MASSEEVVPDPVRTPQGLIKEDIVKTALLKDQGRNAKLTSWKIQDFTSKGDNYACVVSSVEVDYTLNGSEHHTTYIVKLNACRPGQLMEDFTVDIFNKEGTFYTEIVPLLNEELRALTLPELKLPRFIHGHYEPMNEMIFLEDLRKKGFKMCDRRKGMDMAHVTLVLREISRLHAASVLLKNRQPEKTLADRFPCLKEIFVKSDEDKIKHHKSLFTSFMNIGSQIAEKSDGYEDIANWTKEFGKNAYEHFLKSVESKEPFVTICHGDCWNNNLLFRYDGNGTVVDIALLDLQLCRESSPATDLNYMLFSSLTGSVRKPNMLKMLNIYYTSFKYIVQGAGIDIGFTEEELRQEFINKNIFGFIMGMMVLPVVISESDEEPLNLDEFDGDKMDEFLENHTNRVLSMVDSNPLLRPRFLDMYDEMLENGIIGQNLS